MFNELNINWIAVVIATLAFFMLGGIWFTVIFSKAYAVALGKENAPKEKPALIFLLGPLVGDFVTVIAFDILIYAFHIQSISDAIIFGGIVGIGFLASTTVTTGINPNIPRPLVYGLINGFNYLFASLMVSVILVVMR